MSQAELLSPTPLSPSVSLHSGRPATTSLEVAKFFDKRHDNVLRDIDALLSQLPENSLQLNFEETYQEQETPLGVKQIRVFIIYRDGFMLLVMGYTGKKALGMKLAYIEAFNRMEEELARQKESAIPAAPTPDDFTGTLSITPEQQCTLQEIVRAKVEVFPKNQRPSLYAQAWSRFNTHFRLAKYCQLQREKMSEGITYLTRMELAVPVSSVSPAPATALPASPSSPADDAEGHLAAIREHIRQIHRHEESLFLLARKALPAVRKPGDMFSPALRTGLTAFQSMEDCAGALDYSLRALESSARTMLTLGR